MSETPADKARLSAYISPEVAEALHAEWLRQQARISKSQIVENALRKELGLSATTKSESTTAIIERVQERVRPYLTAGRVLSEELIRDRREDAARE